MNVNGTNLSMVRGDSESLTILCYDENEIPKPFEVGDTLYFTIKESVTKIDKVLQKVITTFEDDGSAIIEINPLDTSLLKFKDYVYDIQLTSAVGTVTTIITASVFTILPEVTYD